MEYQILLVESVDTINHGLDKLNLGVSQSVLVGDVISVSGLATRFTTGATGLQVKLLATSLELVDAVLGPAGQVNVDAGPHACAEVGGARVEISVLGVQHKLLAGLGLDRVSDSLDAAGEPLKDSLDVSTLLHGDNPQLILFIYPDLEKINVTGANSKKFR